MIHSPLNQAILDALATPIAVMDGNGVLVSVNRAWKDFSREGTNSSCLMAHEGENYIATCAQDAAGGDIDADRALAGFRNVLHGATPRFGMEYCRGFGEELRWFRLRSAMLDDGSGLVLVEHEEISRRKGEEEELDRYRRDLEALVKERAAALEVINTDLAAELAERRRLERSLEESRRTNELILNTAGEGICGIDLGGRITFINTAAATMTGWKAPELLYRQLHAMVHHTRMDGTPYPHDECPVHITMADGSTRTVPDDIFWRKDGNSFPVEYVVTPVVENGRVTGSVIVFKDITERKLAEQAQQESEEKARAFAETAVNAVALIDNEGKVVYWNPAAVRIFDYTVAEVQGRSLHELLAPARFHESFHGGFSAFRTTGTGTLIGKTTELAARRKDGTEFPIELSMSAVMLKGKWHAIGIMRDITDRKLAERELEQAHRAAQTSSTAKSEFLANISHELRTPLNAVVGFAEYLRDGRAGALTDLQRECLQDIWEGGKHLLRLINDILDLAKIEAGKSDVAYADFSVKQVVGECLFMFRGKAAKHALTLSLEADDTAGEMRADEQKIKQILLNLVANAVKFTPDGGSIVVSARREVCRQTEGGECVRIAVSDSGIGIAPEDVDRLFKPFQQLDSPLTKKYEGTGLGLAICKNLVELHDGRIWVESAPGKGSTFIFEIPARPLVNPATAENDGRQAIPASAMAAPHDKGTTPPAPGTGKRPVILLAEDHPTNRKLILRQLSELGLEATPVRNGEEALAAWKTGEFSLLLSDCHMPVLDGYELARRIRKAEEGSGRRIPLIALTANAMAGEAERCLQAGMDDYLSKPVYLDTIRQMLTKWLPEGAVAADGTGAAIGEPPAAAPAPAVLDISVLGNIFGDNEPAIRATLNNFFKSSDADLAALRSAYEQQGIDETVRVAHRIKGAALIVGAGRLAGICADIESAGRREDRQTLERLFPEFLAAMHDVRREILDKAPPIS
jgi:PAS domain S-box-containing protein